MEDFKLLMDKTIDVYNTTVSIWGYSFTFLDVVGYTIIAGFIILVVRALMWLDDYD